MDSLILHFSKALLEHLGGAVRSKTCSKGMFVFTEGSKYSGPWILNKGVVVLSKSSSEGKEQIVKQVEPGEWFAEVPIFRDLDWYPINARCVSSCDLTLLPAGEVKNALQKNPELAWMAACALSRRITEFRDIIFDLTLAEAKQRLLRYLLRRLEGRPNASLGIVPLGISHQDLALLLGIRAESLSRALTELENSKKIKRLTRQTFQLFLKNIPLEEREL